MSALTGFTVLIKFFRPKNIQLMTSIADLDPGSGTFLTPGSGIRDGGKIRIRDEFHGILDHFSESLETVFLGKNT